MFFKLFYDDLPHKIIFTWNDISHIQLFDQIFYFLMAQEAPRNFLTTKAGTVDGDEKLEAELLSALTTTTDGLFVKKSNVFI